MSTRRLGRREERRAIDLPPQYLPDKDHDHQATNEELYAAREGTADQPATPDLECLAPILALIPFGQDNTQDGPEDGTGYRANSQEEKADDGANRPNTSPASSDQTEPPPILAPAWLIHRSALTPIAPKTVRTANVMGSMVANRSAMAYTSATIQMKPTPGTTGKTTPINPTIIATSATQNAHIGKTTLSPPKRDRPTWADPVRWAVQDSNLRPWA